MNSTHGLYVSLRGYRAARVLSAVCAAILVFALLAVTAPRAEAVLLFDNGPVTGDTGRCDQGPTGCLGSGTWTYYDNFNLAAPSVITGFDYTDWISSGEPANYVITNWSLWNADPFVAAAPVASGSKVATLSSAGGPYLYLFEIGGLNQPLPAGVYWLGINNTVTNDDITSAAAAVGVLAGAKQSDGETHFFNDQPERAFRIYGNAVPEPSALVLFVLGLAAVLSRRSSRIAC